MNEKRKYWFLVLICATAIALLAGLGYALREKQMSFDQSYDRIAGQVDDLRAVMEQPEDNPGMTAAATEAVSLMEAYVPSETEAESVSVSEAETECTPDRLIIVGDSRTVGMQRSVPSYTDPCIYIAASGEGYLWFEASGINRLRRTLARYPGTPVVFNLGVNDTRSIRLYIKIYESLILEYPGSDFWFLSVNPVTEDSLMVPDEDVKEFNKSLRKAFPDQFIDSYSWLKKNGFESVDGVHYTEETYRDIHDFTVEAVLGQTNSEKT